MLYCKFENHVSQDGHYSDNKIFDILSHYQELIFSTLKQRHDLLELTSVEKQLADEYLRYLCFLTAGAILNNKLLNRGFPELDGKFKKIYNAVYNNSLLFVQKYVTTNIIQFPSYAELEEKVLFFQIKLKLEDYTSDVKSFLETGEPCYLEDFEDDDEESKR